MAGTDALLIGDDHSPRTYGTFPPMFAEYVRDEGSISLEEAVRKMTSFAALGLDNREFVSRLCCSGSHSVPGGSLFIGVGYLKDGLLPARVATNL